MGGGDETRGLRASCRHLPVLGAQPRHHPLGCDGGRRAAAVLRGHPGNAAGARAVALLVSGAQADRNDDPDRNGHGGLSVRPAFSWSLDVDSRRGVGDGTAGRAVHDHPVDHVPRREDRRLSHRGHPAGFRGRDDHRDRSRPVLAVDRDRVSDRRSGGWRHRQHPDEADRPHAGHAASGVGRAVLDRAAYADVVAVGKRTGRRLPARSTGTSIWRACSPCWASPSLRMAVSTA